MENLLGHARLTSGPIVLNRQWHDLEELVGVALARLQRELGERNIQMQIDDEFPLIWVAGDLLQQVFINLLMNAVEATPPDGSISINVWPSSNDGRAGVTVAVTDTGVGMSPDALGHAFEPFYTTKPVGEGTGLGLAISRDIVRDHGGTIVAQSRAGEGSTFIVWLPEHEAAA